MELRQGCYCLAGASNSKKYAPQIYLLKAIYVNLHLLVDALAGSGDMLTLYVKLDLGVLPVLPGVNNQPSQFEF